MFRPGSTKRDTFRPARPKHQNIYVSTKFDQARYVLTGATKTSRLGPSSIERNIFRSARLRTSMFRPGSTKRDTFRPARPKHQNIYVSTKYDQARYVLTGATKTSRLGPSSIERNIFRSARLRTSMFRPGSTKRDTFRPRDETINVSTKFDQARYGSIGTTTKLYVLSKFDQVRYVSTGATKTSIF